MKYETSGNDKACSSVASSFNTEVSHSTMVPKEDEVKEKMNDLSIQYDDSTNKYDQFEGDEVCSRDGESNKIRVPLTLDMLPQILLPDDFLRLPSMSSISPSNYSGFRYTVTLQKDSKVGLGMTIRDSYILRNIPTDKVRTAVVVANLDFEGSPARLSGTFCVLLFVILYIHRDQNIVANLMSFYDLGVKLDDVLEEVNGTKVFSVRQAASIIRSLSPKCHPKLSFVRGLNCELQSNDISKTNEHIKNTQHESTVLSAHSASRYKGHHLTHSNKIVEKQPFHPILILLQSRNLVPSSVLSKEEMLKSSSMIKYYSRFESSVSYTRMPLCIRILHQFDDPEGHGIAYTIWVYDVSTGKEWFAPTRFYRDFVDLRTHSIRLCSKISKFSLNKEISGLFQWNANDEYDPNERAILLESFLRDVCTFLYVSCNDDDGIADAALHLRSFLGCDEDVFNSSPTRKQRIGSPSNKDDVCTHRTVQLYVYLLFTLPPFQYLISSFIEETRKRISEIFETANAGRRTTRWLKVVSKGELKRVGICLNQLTDMILEGCKCDISQFRRNAESDHHYPHPSIAIAVREQVEIEVYVPLRSLLSKALVNAYRHEDLEVYYKIKVRTLQDVINLPSRSSHMYFTSMKSN